MTKRWLGVLAAALVIASAGCSGTSKGGGTAAAPSDPAKVSGDITVLTQRTDMVADGTLDKYAAEFNKTYPNVKVKFQGLTDYEGEVKIRMNTEDYGDVLLIPAAVKKDDWPKFFAALGDAKDLDAKYRFISFGSLNGKVYGLANNGNANGLVYNKAVWAKAGVTTWPKTPDEFIAALQAIKSKTDAVPLYTNYHDKWPLTAWNSYVGEVTCDVNANDKLATSNAPWTAGQDLYVIDSLQYNVVKNKLVEADPTTTNWEASKGQIATGKIATMALGSWSVSQFQAAATKAGQDPKNIGVLPFPTQVDGKYCVTVAPDYQQAVSIHSKHPAAARAWLDWFTDKSGYAESQGSLPTLKAATMPETIKPYTDAGAKFIEMTQDKAAVVNNIDNASEIGLSKPDYHQKIVDLGRGTAPGTLDAYFADLNKKWAAAVKTAGS
jgi:ABC-type glycerol-3-phosphate transport system substrate-binding protein